MNDHFDPGLATLAETTRPLLAAVRAGLADLLAGGPDAVRRCAAQAPVDAAVRLAGAWAAADTGGLPTASLLQTLPAEDRLLVELVTAVSGGRATDRWPPVLDTPTPVAMHADDWDHSSDLGRMAELLAVADRGRLADQHLSRVMLFVAGLCRDVWPLIIDPRYRLAVEAAERFWTGQTGTDPYSAASNAISWPYREDLPAPQTAQQHAERAARELDVYESADFPFAMTAARDFAVEAVRRSPRTPKGADYLRPFNGTDTVLCGRLRCLLANPFRPAPAFDPAWRTPAVAAVAAGILADRDFSRLPVLADALDDAGCDDAELLAHARGPGPHVFGCRAVSVCLGHGS